MSLNERYGSGAAQRLEELLGAPSTPAGPWGTTYHFGTGLVAIEYENVFTFVECSAKGLLTALAGVFGQFGLEYAVEGMVITADDYDDRRALMHVGFRSASKGSEMRATPQRLSDYYEWKVRGGQEPYWHSNLGTEFQ